jgi:hypothetical protein
MRHGAVEKVPGADSRDHCQENPERENPIEEGKFLRYARRVCRGESRGPH